MFQPFKGKQNLGVFKAVLKLASSQLRLSVQIWTGSTKEILNSFPPSARFSTFSCARSVLRVVLLLKDLYIHIFKNSPCPPGASLFLCCSSALSSQVFALSMAQSTGLQLDLQTRAAIQAADGWKLSLESVCSWWMTSYTWPQLHTRFWTQSEYHPPEKPYVVCTSASRSSREADGKAVDWCKSNVIRKGVLHMKRQSEPVKV